ncbi:MAG: hypothetical protein KC733_06930 [Candidatus Omnitrophica bacterium]|nr:hypothetical protein [Candidatus Omnitrophota bacterium]
MKRVMLLLITLVGMVLLVSSSVQAYCPINKGKDESPAYRFGKKFGYQPYYFSDEARSRYFYYAYEKKHYQLGEIKKFNPRLKDDVYKWYARYYGRECQN